MKLMLKSLLLMALGVTSWYYAQAQTSLADVRGVSLPSLEWACVQYDQVYDFPLVETTKLLKQWKVNTVRLPLNQECWLDDKKYQAEVKKTVAYFADNDLSVIIDLHWNKPSRKTKSAQQVMANTRSVTFWKSVATAFKKEPAVIAFELYNEPHTIDWDCWKNGCITKEGWKVSGMQSLVNAVRSTGANQWVIVNGLNWANNVPGTVANLPKDSKNKIALGWHVYDEYEDKDKCTTTDCFEKNIVPIAEKYPVIITEFGSRLLCDPSHNDRVMQFASKHDIGFVAWAWYPADCGFPALIKDWSGTPTEAGKKFCDFLGGNCPAVTKPITPLTPTQSTHQVSTGLVLPSVSGQPLCFVNFKNGVLSSSNITCSEGYTVVLTGKTAETWDYYTNAGRTKNGTELWSAAKGNVTTEANDRIRFLLIRANTTGSLTVYDDVDQKGSSLTLTVKKR
jgi:hypothetical protein